MHQAGHRSGYSPLSIKMTLLNFVMRCVNPLYFVLPWHWGEFQFVYFNWLNLSRYLNMIAAVPSRSISLSRYYFCLMDYPRNNVNVTYYSPVATRNADETWRESEGRCVIVELLLHNKTISKGSWIIRQLFELIIVRNLWDSNLRDLGRVSLSVDLDRNWHCGQGCLSLLAVQSMFVVQ